MELQFYSCQGTFGLFPKSPSKPRPWYKIENWHSSTNSYYLINFLTKRRLTLPNRFVKLSTKSFLSPEVLKSTFLIKKTHHACFWPSFPWLQKWFSIVRWGKTKGSHLILIWETQEVTKDITYFRKNFRSIFKQKCCFLEPVVNTGSFFFSWNSTYTYFSSIAISHKEWLSTFFTF